MLRAPLVYARTVAILFILVLAPSVARAQDAASPGLVGEMPLPGGIRAALAALDDPVPPDRSQFLLEVIRRVHGGVPADVPRVQRLLDHLDRRAREDGAGDTLPLPLGLATWTTVVFKGQVTPTGLAAAILRSPDAARFYCAALALDDVTRAWLDTQPRLIRELVSQHSTAFLLAAPGLRVAGGRARLPGGTDATPVWEAVAGRRADDPAAFVSAVVADVRLAYVVGAVADLAPAQVRFLVGLDAPEAQRRVEATRRMIAVFARALGEWNSDRWTFWRPSMDPALLVADLATDGQGRPALPGTERFWTAALGPVGAGRDAGGDAGGDAALAEGAPVDFGWLCERVFTAPAPDRRGAYQAVLFASRRVAGVTPGAAGDARDAVRAAARLPALVAALERAGVEDLHVFARAARRADQLSAIRQTSAANRALTAFQGTLAILTRAALRGSVSADTLPRLVVSLSGVDVSDTGDYEGRLVRWANANLPQDLVPLLAGPVPRNPREVEWEGTRYRLDFATPEMMRLRRLLDDDHSPSLATARALVDTADDLASGTPTRERAARAAATLQNIETAIADDERERVRDAARQIDQIRRRPLARDAARAAALLLSIADEEFARGVRHIAYAVSFRPPDADASLVDDVAARHTFGPSPDRTAVAWVLPFAGSEAGRAWHASGSLLGLDAALASISLVRLSGVPPHRPPSIDGADRRALIDTVALVDAASLTDEGGRAIVSGMARGRARLAAVHTAADGGALADRVRMSAVRRSLLAWVIAHDPARLPAFLSPLEWLWAGMDAARLPTSVQGWGATAGPPLGCLCVRLLEPRPLEMLAGRWTTGMLASGFSDLNLRLTQLLDELHMPASLLAPMLPAATAELVDETVSRDRDDRRGLQEYVLALTSEQVEQYLATLTVDGPLVPVSGAGPAAPTLGVSR